MKIRLYFDFWALLRELSEINSTVGRYFLGLYSKNSVDKWIKTKYNIIKVVLQGINPIDSG